MHILAAVFLYDYVLPGFVNIFNDVYTSFEIYSMLQGNVVLCIDSMHCVNFYQINFQEYCSFRFVEYIIWTPAHNTQNVWKIVVKHREETLHVFGQNKLKPVRHDCSIILFLQQITTSSLISVLYCQCKINQLHHHIWPQYSRKMQGTDI